MSRRSPVLHVSHRGGAREAPENTLYAFRRAVALGTDMLELDVRATADGEIVVFHDATVDRTTSGTGAISDLTYAQLAELDAAHWFSPDRGTVHSDDDGDYPLRGVATGARRPQAGVAPADLRVPTLRQVLEALPGVPLTMEIKAGPPDDQPYHEAVAELLDAFDRPVIVGSFHDPILEAFREHAPRRHTSATRAETAMFWSEGVLPADRNIVALQVPITYEGIEVVTEGFVAAAHDHRLQVHVWTVDEEEEMRRLIDLGVDGIMSDLPSVLATVLGR